MRHAFVRTSLIAAFTVITAGLASAQTTVTLPDSSQTTTLTAAVSEQAQIAVPAGITFTVNDIASSTAASADDVTVSNIALGPYRTITDESGGYVFAKLPDGRIELRIDKDKLPAAYVWVEEPRVLDVTSRTYTEVDLQVVPLNAIRGRVYLDRNGNGRFDPDEGIGRVVIMVGGTVTATDGTGAFAFYNEPPGHYTIRLDATRLPDDLTPTCSPKTPNRSWRKDAEPSPAEGRFPQRFGVVVLMGGWIKPDLC